MANKNPRASVFLLAAIFGLLALIAGFRISSSMSGSKGGDNSLSETQQAQIVARPDESVSGLEKRSSTTGDSDTNQVASKPDAQMETLRARLRRPGVVPGEAVLSFRSKDAMNRFLQ
jgi:hypothetical protein